MQIFVMKQLLFPSLPGINSNQKDSKMVQIDIADQNTESSAVRILLSYESNGSRPIKDHPWLSNMSTSSGKRTKKNNLHLIRLIVLLFTIKIHFVCSEMMDIEGNNNNAVLHQKSIIIFFAKQTAYRTR